MPSTAVQHMHCRSNKTRYICLLTGRIHFTPMYVYVQYMIDLLTLTHLRRSRAPDRASGVLSEMRRPQASNNLPVPNSCRKQDNN
jgi:hypothetical protein